MFARLIIAIVMVLVSVGSSAFASISLTMEKIASDNNPGVDLSGQLNVRFLSAAEALSEYGAFVPAMGANDVLLTIQNVVGTASNIAEVYVRGGGALATLVSPPSPLVLGGSHSFSVGDVDPGQLPGGSWDPDLAFSADVNPGPPSRGLDQSADILGMLYTTNSPFGLSAVQSALDSGELRVGFHIRSIAPAGGSDSYQNQVAVVPEVTAFIIWSVIGAMGLSFARQRA